MKEPNTPKIDQLSEEAYVDPIGKTLTSSFEGVFCFEYFY